MLRKWNRNTTSPVGEREYSRGRQARAPGRREHERKHPKGVACEQLQDGQRERSGLAAAGVRGAHHVAPAQDGWDAAALHSRRVLHAQRLAHPVARQSVNGTAGPATEYNTALSLTDDSAEGRRAKRNAAALPFVYRILPAAACPVQGTTNRHCNSCKPSLAQTKAVVLHC